MLPIVVVAFVFSLVINDAEPKASSCVSDTGEVGELSDPLPLGERCIFVNELNYIRDTGIVKFN